MFLSNLSVKEQYCFLEFADKLIHSDSERKNVEEALYSSYTREMGLTQDYVIQGIDLEAIIDAVSDIQSQKIIYLELLALSGIDSDYSSDEKSFLQRIATGFNLPEDFIIDCERWIEELSDSYKKGHSLIFGGNGD